MENREILKSQKNQLYQLIGNYALEPANFDWSKVESEFYSFFVSKISYRGTPFFFIFDRKEFEDLAFVPEVPYCKYSPSDSDMVNSEFCNNGWEEIFQLFKKWLRNLNREIQETDLWGDMLKYQSQLSLSVPDTSKDEPISCAEYEMIEDRVVNFFEEIKKQYTLTQEQIKLLNKNQSILLDMAKKQTYQAWMYATIGVIATMVMSIPSIQEDMGRFSDLVKLFFGHIIHLIK